MTGDLIFLTVGIGWAVACYLALRWAWLDMARARIGEDA